METAVTVKHMRKPSTPRVCLMSVSLPALIAYGAVGLPFRWRIEAAVMNTDFVNGKIAQCSLRIKKPVRSIEFEVVLPCDSRIFATRRYPDLFLVSGWRNRQTGLFTSS